MKNNEKLTRRDFIYYTGAVGLLTGLKSIVPSYALDFPTSPGVKQALKIDNIIDLAIDKTTINLGNRKGNAITVNGSIPGPLIRMQEDEDITIRVTNKLNEDTSIHWHGILLPPEMDGVPGVSFPGIKPGETFTYQYPVRQSGTYWYHSHSGLQEQSGHYGPLIVDPSEPDPVKYDREYVVMLSDWTFEDPHEVMMNLKKMDGYYNFRKRTVADFFHDGIKYGWKSTISDRLAWGGMRMSPTDIADVTGFTYTYLMNGMPPEANWTGLFTPGERIRLRFINGSAMSYFNVRIPGLALTVVQADGQNVQPVTVDEFQIGVAETYDVIVNPQKDQAYTVFAESMDRSGYTSGTLSTQVGMSAPIPELRKPPLRTMIDMGMDMGEMGHGGHGGMQMNEKSLSHESHEMHSENSDMKTVNSMVDHGDHEEMNMESKNMKSMPSMVENAGPVIAKHGPDHHGPGNVAVAQVQRNRLGEPGTGLEDVDHRVLVYNDLKNLTQGLDNRKPGREIELHLTGNMEQYMWSFDGKKFSEVKEPIKFIYGERLKLTMVNDTMMEHPIHLHGMFMELDNGSGEYMPRKHTISIKPAERLSMIITADEAGNWAFHCHLLYHMEAGMFRVVNVSPEVEEV